VIAVPKIVMVDAVTDAIHTVSEASNGSLPVKTTTGTSGKPAPTKKE